MASCALSARRQVLRRPKVCRTPRNPGRCEEILLPPACPPPALTGYFELAGREWCHGEAHHYDFVAPRYSDYEDPWYYRHTGPSDPPANHCEFALWQTPAPRLYAFAGFSDVPGPMCAAAEKHGLPIDWCSHQLHVIDDWDPISEGLTCHLEVSW